MKRREFIAGLGSAAALPVVARTQQRALPVIGYLSSNEETPESLRAFRQGVNETGFAEDRNVVIEYRWSADEDKLTALAAEFVARPVNVIVSESAVATAHAIKASAGAIPIVFNIGPDPLKLGFVASLSRPSGNVTGVTNLNTEIAPKRLELLHQVLPAANTIAFLDNPTNPGSVGQNVQMQAAADILGVTLVVLHAGSEHELEVAFNALHGFSADGIVIGADNFFNTHMEQLAALTARHRVPAIFQFRDFVVAGGVMSYGPPRYNLELSRQTGVYAGRLLKGEKPADLPVVQPTKFELVINMQTARLLGIEVPPTLLAVADEAIE
jgi:putative tryptophan/tyrosine transport system substrate-binding protein